MQNHLFKLATRLFSNSSYNEIIKLATNNEGRFARKINIDFIANKLNKSDGKTISSAIDNDEGFFTLEQINQIAAFPLDKWTKPGFDPKTSLGVDVRAFLVIANVLGFTTSSLIDDYIVGCNLKSSKLMDKIVSSGLAINWTNLDFYKSGIRILDDLQKKWHDDLASKQKETSLNTMLNYSIVWSNESSDIIYVPSNAEMECYPGLPDTSYDRIVLGNKLGICLGSKLKYYQDNSDGQIYALCIDKNPVVCIRIKGYTLYEAKGKNNSNCPLNYAEIIISWFLSANINIKLEPSCGIILRQLIYSKNKEVSNYALSSDDESEYTQAIKNELSKNNNWINETRNQQIIFIDSNKIKHWYVNGVVHRKDGPAVEEPNGFKEWYQNGELHRVDGPAVEYTNGHKAWYINGKLHRINGPAVEYANGDKEWDQYGELHRKDGPAIENANGDKEWYINGELHREDGPAIEFANGHKQWWVNGKLHRLDGPAVEHANGNKEWWINGKGYTEKEYNNYIKNIKQEN